MERLDKYIYSEKKNCFARADLAYSRNEAETNGKTGVLKRRSKPLLKYIR